MTFHNSSSYSTNSVSESTGLRNSKASNIWKRLGCYGGTDGFTVIASCFFVLTVAITFALVIQIFYGSPEITPHGAVATDDVLCSTIGRDIMSMGGSSGDVIVAALFCLSVTHPHLVGPGGGGVAIVHDHKLNKSKVFDFMSGIPKGLEDYKSNIDSNDRRSIGIPGFLKGMERLHHRYGLLPWEALIMPSVNLAKDGFRVSPSLWNELSKEQIESGTNLGRIFLRKGVLIAQNELLKRIPYARLLQDIARHGSDEFYHPDKYAKEVIEVLKRGSNVSFDDLQAYKVIESDVLKSQIRNRTVITAGSPFGGMQVLVGLKFLEKAKLGPYWPDTKLYKMFAQAIDYGKREMQEYMFSGTDSLSDITSDRKRLSGLHKYSEQTTRIFYEELPATQVSVIDTSDIYISAIVGLGTNFGSRVVTKHEIIYNNHLANYLYLPKKNSSESTFKDISRPFSPYTPLLIMDQVNVCGQRSVLSSGSSSAVTQVSAHILFRGADLTQSIVEPRLSVGPNKEILVNDVEPLSQRLSGEVRNYFTSHNYTLSGIFIPLSVNGMTKHGDQIVSHSDTRGGGVAARLIGMGERNKPPRYGNELTSDMQSVSKIISSDPSNIVTIKVPDAVETIPKPIS